MPKFRVFYQWLIVVAALLIIDEFRVLFIDRWTTLTIIVTAAAVLLYEYRITFSALYQEAVRKRQQKEQQRRLKKPVIS